MRGGMAWKREESAAASPARPPSTAPLYCSLTIFPLTRIERPAIIANSRLSFCGTGGRAMKRREVGERRGWRSRRTPRERAAVDRLPEAALTPDQRCARRRREATRLLREAGSFSRAAGISSPRREWSLRTREVSWEEWAEGELV